MSFTSLEKQKNYEIGIEYFSVIIIHENHSIWNSADYYTLFCTRIPSCLMKSNVVWLVNNNTDLDSTMVKDIILS